MKIVLGIFVVVLLIAALALYFLFMLNSHDLISCGDITQTNGGQLSVTRIYTSDLNANETLSEIVNKMNDKEDGQITADEMTELLATYQNIIYAPVFTFTITQEDTETFVLTGSVYNGLNEDGEPTSPDFRYKDLGMTVTLPEGRILTAQNVYDDVDDGSEDGEVEFIERRRVIDPIIIADGKGAAFAFRDCSSFRIVFKGLPETPPSITLAYTYNIVADNPLNFTSLKSAVLGATITVAYDEEGRFTPQLEIDRRNIVVDGEEEE